MTTSRTAAVVAAVAMGLAGWIALQSEYSPRDGADAARPEESTSNAPTALPSLAARPPTPLATGTFPRSEARAGPPTPTVASVDLPVPSEFPLDFVDAGSGEALVRAGGRGPAGVLQTKRDGLVDWELVVPTDPRRWTLDQADDEHLVFAAVADAKTTKATVPLRRVITLRLRAANESTGEITDDVRLQSWAMGQNRGLRLPSQSGEREARVPFFPGEPVWVHVVATLRVVPTTRARRERIGSDGAIHAAVRVVLPEVWREFVDVAVPIDDEHTFADDDMPFEESLGDGGVPEFTASIRARVVRVDGAPAGHAYVRIHGSPKTTDDSGLTPRVEVEAPAQITLSIVDPSMTPCTAVVSMRAGDALEVTLLEPEPASLAVSVTIPDGRPAPYARLKVATPSGVAPLDLVDGTLRVDSYTGVDGRRTFTRVEPAEVTVTATWGSRLGTATVSLAPGRRGSVRVVLPEPPTTAPPGFREIEETR